MNTLQALPMLARGLSPPVTLSVHDATPNPRPAGPYAVVTDGLDGKEFQLHAQEDGHAPQVRRLTVLVTLFAGQDQELADFRPLYHAARKLPDLVTRHPGLPPLGGISLGPCAAPRPGSSQGERPWAAVRLILTYTE
ncbi:hypothetical protein [Deinococcus hopiensis]|uniref:DUF3168 domain-containing protein n=1 Tax=Deinococcus hopiensis KR-140 TaxID=695939 RepID=A0A1W1UYH0_9DEIO|nr:hypothetical protein [Deinococcus hopiensis]SMB85784.1 hypothetical protein SAMN00790413_03542 [Deinococcus hopiensis KR-140]